MTKELEFAVRTAKEAGSVLLDYFGKTLEKTIKSGPNDFVTDADLAAEKLILQAIQASYPQDGIISEEAGEIAGSSDFTWIVDPLDGTYNFANKNEIFGVMISRAFKGEVVLTAIYCPKVDALVTSEKGGGVYRNGEKVSLQQPESDRPTITVSMGLGQVVKLLGEGKENYCAAGDLLGITQGMYQALVWMRGSVWDHAPAALIAQELGWKTTDKEGNEFRTDHPIENGRPGVIAAAGELHSQLSEAFL